MSFLSTLRLGPLLFLAALASALAADRSASVLLLDGTVIGSEVIVVGERGAILRSEDNGRSWHPAAGPARATLTGVSFATLTAPRHGWAVGHDAQIWATTDAGRTWVKQYQGESLADSFLDVLALDAQRVIAVGAYGAYLSTTNGGATWTKRTIAADDFHLNRITRGPGGVLYVAGERGTLLRSADSGTTWTPLSVAYTGSFYGVLPLERGALLAYGLRGHVFRSEDEGRTWQQISMPEPVLLASAVKLKGDTVVLAGQSRTVWVSRDLGRTFTPRVEAAPAGVAELLELPDGNLLALGEAGASVMPKP
ncbi:WD40/YVTN/BNR-like repeat-containing protein [Horticoccus sp. 23ND18S-11]|uniref:WD40/YVTN/BNR-like repeat-containing protein n=1 Tax=Horticoccus sp. 23ND18S-11 TaxID=3391832 RepID=UPI0039C96C0C